MIITFATTIKACNCIKLGIKTIDYSSWCITFKAFKNDLFNMHSESFLNFFFKNKFLFLKYSKKNIIIFLFFLPGEIFKFYFIIFFELFFWEKKIKK